MVNLSKRLNKKYYDSARGEMSIFCFFDKKKCLTSEIKDSVSAITWKKSKILIIAFHFGVGTISNIYY